MTRAEQIAEILEAAKKGWHSNLVVRKQVDESGDYPIVDYTILSILEYGPHRIAEGMDNPYMAQLFAGAPLLADEVVRLQAVTKRLAEVLEPFAEIIEQEDNLIERCSLSKTADTDNIMIPRGLLRRAFAAYREAEK